MSHGEQSDCVLPSCTKPEECGKAGHCLGNGEASATSTPEVAVEGLSQKGRTVEFRRGMRYAADLHEQVDPASDMERQNGSPGAGAMGAVIEFRDLIRKEADE